MRTICILFILSAITASGFCDDMETVIGNVNITGDTATLEELPFAQDAYRGVAANAGNFETIALHLLEFFDEHGYPFAQISFDDLKLENDNAIDITLLVTAGPLVYFDTCRVEGCDAQTAAYLRRIAAVKPGDTFMDSDIDRTIQIFRMHGR